ncbi:MAG: asparagine synthase (glutamine-hydrolyzing) [Ruminococcaceae bacterium]|nr:asparagine synthase (glutamine-hydrolyzing) [Oscillospiraceae bacterium]
MKELKIYSGHIRNWKELCIALGVDNELPREKREEEIILKAYEKWGGEMGLHIHGMFSFAIFDSEDSSLFCMRDPFGTKPFYYYETEDGKMLVGTTIREIMEQEGFCKELNQKMLQIYLTMTYTTGEETFFKGVKKLLPGRFLVKRNGKTEIKRYWKPEFRPDNSKTLEEWADELHSTLKSVMQEVKEDGEYVESFLSGGVDSSYVLALSDATACNSCGYNDERLDESHLAEKTAEILDRKFNRCLIEPEDYFAAVPYVMYNMEQPLGDASAVAFALGCIATAKNTKICYSGEGADEFFGGYNMYRNAERYGDNLKTFYVGNTNIMKEEEKQKILKKYYDGFLPIDLVESIYAENEGLDPLSKMSDVDIQVWLEGDIYLNVDKMSRAAGLEVRMPLTDLRIFDIASRIPSKFKVNEEQNKVVLRTAAAKVLPEEIAFRKKLGFVVPIRMWMADSRYNKDVIAKFNSESAEKFFNVDEINAIFEEYIGGNSDNWRKVWTIYTFLVWYEEYFVKR